MDIATFMQIKIFDIFKKSSALQILTIRSIY